MKKTFKLLLIILLTISCNSNKSLFSLNNQNKNLNYHRLYSQGLFYVYHMENQIKITIKPVFLIQMESC